MVKMDRYWRMRIRFDHETCRWVPVKRRSKRRRKA